jgi:hypothetical protein
MVGQERTDFAPSMDRAAIPEQVDRAAQMTEQVLEERSDVEAAEILRATPEIQRHTPPLGRHRQPAANREAIVTVAVAHARGLSRGGPGASDVGDEQEPALIYEDEMGATSSGVFLSGASRPASSGRWRPRPARRHGAPASGNSTPARSAPSRHALGDTARRTPRESVWPPAAASRDPSGTRRAAGPGPAASRVGASAPGTVAQDVPGWVWRPAPGDPSAGTPATIERPNSRPPQCDARRPRGSGPTLTAGPRDDGASPVAWTFQVVA